VLKTKSTEINVWMNMFWCLPSPLKRKLNIFNGKVLKTRFSSIQVDPTKNTHRPTYLSIYMFLYV